MSVQEQEEENNTLVQKVFDLYHSISNLPTLKPSKETNNLFTQLVHLCIPPSPIDVSRLPKPASDMRSRLIRLCGEAEGLLESHYATLLASHANPLDHLHLFPYHSNYLKLSLLEHTILTTHTTTTPTSIAFIGSGPLPLTSIILATRHLTRARFHNYDIDTAANAKAARLVRADPELRARMTFRTADVMEVGARELRAHDVVFLAALVGMSEGEKEGVLEHLGRNMAPGALLMLRSARGARAFLYPVVEAGMVGDRLRGGFEVLSVYHPEDEVINSVVVARRCAAGVGVVVRPSTCPFFSSFR
ncbi:Nicotianamine synthase [Acorus gramineus]|uniref:Nicotianamine synthase n=1 Tax=Acorus gramineus TaxID=55184 RepID=A0AAV9BNI6_ACOGR|nr:Nicotianamine synthase [Acorus gramineus]